ncbi:ABC transporter permease [Bradyrhizobium erythrophlei]|jgi:NitT/TauT family transport system permease protein|uniref:NitT/TauT family transport system permease protein n=1 Tax=Bradyrhizobium erythrophlei TaxID=1437360 RepID=A0A1M5LBX3_9BRAD|nr:ABC transporter permease [Bradyrhizobium erythrophlei]SHG62470.1 NitT/TauT family transport system permease protein [Bradyrhizobium erythrophlei]
MNPRRLRLGYILAVAGMLLALVLPLSTLGAAPLPARPMLLALSLAAALLFAVAAWAGGSRSIAFGFAGVFCVAVTALVLLRDASVSGSAGAGFWAMVLAVWLAAALGVMQLASARPRDERARRALNLAVPLLFGAAVFYLWEVWVRGFGVSPVIMPAPSAAAARFASSLAVLGGDFVQTFIRGVLIGYVIGCGAGLLVAIVAQRFAFLGRGLLPLGNFFSALPLVGVAPIMVMWFGFDWPSKAAVVALVTFFPMLVNTLAGLSASGHMERDLMRSYGADHRQTLAKLYLPAALPFIFNALKINATLALIGAIVAEFFGTPTQGIGFRISTEAGRMALDMVWAEIALAAIAGMAFYGLVALAERATTFWHPSYRT